MWPSQEGCGARDEAVYTMPSTSTKKKTIIIIIIIIIIIKASDP
jgi:t-SNARE complex subunit (syntaxin)